MNDTTAEFPAAPAPLSSHGASALTGEFATPGDRAMSHQALLLGALAVGTTRIEGLLEADAVLTTAAALRQLGVHIHATGGAWQVQGLGVAGLLAPQGRLDLGNSEMGLNLLLGLLAPYAFSSRFTGGPALTHLSLRRLLDALDLVGVTIEESVDSGLPLTLRGSQAPVPFHLAMTRPSEAIKGAMLLAATQIAGTSTIIEPVPTHDHLEKLLARFGADIAMTHDETGGTTVSVTGLAELRPTQLSLPGDPSLACYPLVAALIVPGSDLLVQNVLVNPARTGLIDTLLEMGGDIQFRNQREIGGEHIADLRVRSSRLKGMRISAEHAACMLDDIPALAAAAAYAHGETVIEGLGELREKETDRLAALAAGLAACKVTVAEGDASLTIGGEGKVEGGGTVASRGDAAIAMGFLLLGLASRRAVTLDDTAAIADTFPGFVQGMTAVGARFEPPKGR
jgi:3-phosphoshikimate 1-carboxyvinyltransferase